MSFHPFRTASRDFFVAIVEIDGLRFYVSDGAVLTFLIAGLLYLLRFERVDNLGAYSIPSETGLLPRKPKPLWEVLG